MMELTNKNVLVVGLARSGLAAANFLQSQGAIVTITDKRDPQELQSESARLHPSIVLSLGGHPSEVFEQADLIVLSPGVPSSIEPLQRARAAGIAVWSEVELAYPFLQGPVIGVTGSNGKTTTTTLIGRLFEQSDRSCLVAGNIGSPLTLALNRPPGSETTYVVELSSFQLENIIDFRCHIALLLNLTPDHLDRYTSFEEYAAAKERIFLNQDERDFAVLNAEDPLTRSMAEKRRSQVLFFSSRRLLDEGISLEEDKIVIRWKNQRFLLMGSSELKLKGRHNLENVLAAAAAGFLSGLPLEQMAEAFREFEGVEHRLELVEEIGGVAFYNDSKATNVDSARKAIESFSQPLVLIMGGLDKGGDFLSLKPLLQAQARLLILIGQAADKIASDLGDSVLCLRAGDLHEAVQLAQQKAQPGDTVVLAPACASFDMFDNFEHRGRAFKASVRNLKAERDAINR